MKKLRNSRNTKVVRIAITNRTRGNEVLVMRYFLLCSALSWSFIYAKALTTCGKLDQFQAMITVGMYRLSIRYLVSAGYLTIRYYPDPVK